MQAIIVANGTAEEIAALALAVQGQQFCVKSNEGEMGPGALLVLNE